MYADLSLGVGLNSAVLAGLRTNPFARRARERRRVVDGPRSARPAGPPRVTQSQGDGAHDQRRHRASRSHPASFASARN